ncbi:hypothetical protein Sjap_014361 [Stephania japonica]|uniref:Uncharacterized protein n=1 Tax=Stephania japonica TaxID=461633 RepID=A0AAP0IZN6_9MAGN
MRWTAQILLSRGGQTAVWFGKPPNRDQIEGLGFGDFPNRRSPKPHQTEPRFGSTPSDGRPNPKQLPSQAPNAFNSKAALAARLLPQRQPVVHRSIGNRVGVYDPRTLELRLPGSHGKYMLLRRSGGIRKRPRRGRGTRGWQVEKVREVREVRRRAALGGEDVGVGVGVGIGGVGVWRWWDERRGGWCSHFSSIWVRIDTYLRFVGLKVKPESFANTDRSSAKDKNLGSLSRGTNERE